MKHFGRHRTGSRATRRTSRRPAGAAWFWRLFLVVSLLVASGAMLGEADEARGQYSSGKIPIFFFDPDSNMKRIRRAKAAINRYLSTVDKRMVFEPFSKWSTFESNTRSRKPKFVIVSSLFYNKTKRLGRIKPLMVPLRNGQRTYRKVVVVQSSSITAMTHLHGRTFASTSKAGLALLAKSGVTVSRLRVISVSKDMDALLALSFGRVDGALVSNRSIKILGRLSPGAVSKIRILYRTSPILRSRLCTLGWVSAETINLVKKAFRKMPSHRSGKMAMRYLGFDRWSTVRGGG